MGVWLCTLGYFLCRSGPPTPPVDPFALQFHKKADAVSGLEVLCVQAEGETSTLALLSTRSLPSGSSCAGLWSRPDQACLPAPLRPAAVASLGPTLPPRHCEKLIFMIVLL